MDYLQEIISEVKTLPESDLPAVLKYIQSLKTPPAAKNKPVLSNKTKPARSKDTIIVYTDGACTGNPGKGGYGAVIIDSIFRSSGAF